MKGKKSSGIVATLLGSLMVFTACSSKSLDSSLPFVTEPCRGKAPIENYSERGLNEAKCASGFNYIQECKNNKNVDWGKIIFYNEGEFMYADEGSNE